MQMPNEDIITALKNATDRGDTLESAKQIMISSGYNPREVEEASQFIGGGVITNQQPKQQEILMMPNQKPSLASKLNFGKRAPIAPIKSPTALSRIPRTQQITTRPTQQMRTKQPTIQHLQPQQVSTQQIKQAISPRAAQNISKAVSLTSPPTQNLISQKPISPQTQNFQLQPSPIKRQLQQIAPIKQGHGKEIILLVLLLILIGLLITTIVLKDTILGWFS